MPGFKSPGQARRFLSVHGVIQHCFRLGRHQLRAAHCRLLQARSFAAWSVATSTQVTQRDACWPRALALQWPQQVDHTLWSDVSPEAPHAALINHEYRKRQPPRQQGASIDVAELE